MLALVATQGAACTTGAVAPTDEVTSSTTFESGWDAWSGDSAFVRVNAGEPVPIAWSLAEDVPGLTGRCALLEHQNRSGRTRQWIEKSFPVEAGEVTATVSFTVGRVGTQGLQRSALAAIGVLRPWVAGDPAAVLSDLGPIGTLEDTPGAIQSFQLTDTLRVSPGEVVWVAVGYLSRFEVSHSICLDDIQIALRK